MEKKRWFLAANALMGFLFLGLIYAWSVFVGPLELEFGWTRSQTSLTFSICMAMFCVGGLAAGWLLKKTSPRAVIVLCGVVIMAGFLLASRVGSLYELYIFYGAFCGFAVGVGYNTLLDVTLRWFPERQGLISGALLMGFGVGGSVLGSVALFMINAMGWRGTFKVLGVALALSLIAISLNVRKPPSDQEKRQNGGQDFPTGQMLRDRSFYAYYFRSMFVAAIGLAMIGNAAPFVYSVSNDPVAAASIGGLPSVFSGVGRIAGGVAFDKIGSRKALWLGIGGVTLSMSILTWAAVSGSLAALTAGYVMGGFFYGANVPCNAGYTNKIYGQKNFAVNLGILNTNVVFSSFLGPYVAGVLFTRTGAYAAPCVMSLAMCGGGVAATALLRRHYVPEK
ncbi:MAG: MFS transporter [Synergistaceae bacterium]|nr:MFS transporter [Synergistaceae bacterium]